MEYGVGRELLSEFWRRVSRADQGGRFSLSCWRRKRTALSIVCCPSFVVVCLAGDGGW